MNNEMIPIDSLPEETKAVVLPIVQQFGAILEKISADNHMMSQRITDLEKQVRLQKPLSRSQENYVNGAIRKRAKELLEEKGCREDRRAVTKLGGLIRKSILARYGVGSLREAPAYDYETALEEAETWMNYVELKKIVKEARERAEGTA